MSHDLKAINAALRLGDVFLLPKGTVCRAKYTPCNSTDFVVLSKVNVLRAVGLLGMRVGIAWKALREWRGHGHAHSLIIFAGDVEEIYLVPGDAAPFEEWERPG